MKNSISKIFFAILLTAPLSSWALFEARATVGATQAKPDITSICNGSCGTPSNAASASYVPGVGADAIVKLPLIPFGFGLRYEGIKLTGDNTTMNTEIKYTRTAVLVNYRLIDTIVHFGPIASYGISHTGSLSIKENNNTVVELAPTTMSSYSAGLELEVKPLIIIPLIVGAEAGYMSFKWTDVTNSIDSSKKDVDLSGTYIKVFIGLDI
jgi:hypothetical protein